MDQATRPAGDRLALTMVRRFAAPPDIVFRAWTDPAQLARWFGMRQRTIHIETLEARAGGRYRILYAGGGMPENAVTGTFREIVPPRRLVFSWAWEAGPGGMPTEETLVTVTLRAVGKETELSLTHEGFGAAAWRDRHEQGWSGGLERLAELFAG